MDVSYHIVQYTNIITELREEIKRLRVKLDTQSQHYSGAKPNIQAVQCKSVLFKNCLKCKDEGNLENAN